MCRKLENLQESTKLCVKASSDGSCGCNWPVSWIMVGGKNLAETLIYSVSSGHQGFFKAVACSHHQLLEEFQGKVAWRVAKKQSLKKKDHHKQDFTKL